MAPGGRLEPPPMREITTTAILPCRGGSCYPERPERHRFTRFADRVEAGAVTDIDLMYRCDGCGHERVWGSFDPELFRAALLH